MCQRVNTGESYIFYFGIFLCGATFNVVFTIQRYLALRIVNRIVTPESVMHWCIGESFHP